MSKLKRAELITRLWLWCSEIIAENPWLLPTIIFIIAGILIIIAITLAIKANKPF